jgi:hypothetical protein
MKKLAFLVIMLITTTFFLFPWESLCDVELNERFDIRVFLSGSPYRNIFGLAASSDGFLYVSDFWKVSEEEADTKNEKIYEINLKNMCRRTVLSSPPLSYPARILVGDGSDLVETDLIVSDWNSMEEIRCCEGIVIRVPRATGNYEVLAKGKWDFSPGDPFGIALGTDKLFGELYVMDFQGAAADKTPVLYRIYIDKEDGKRKRKLVLREPEKWTANRDPRDIVFGNGGVFGYDLYVADTNYNGLGTIWKVTFKNKEKPELEKFVEDAAIKSPESIEFGPGGDFGTNMYVLDSAQGKIFTVFVSPDKKKKISEFASGLPTPKILWPGQFYDMTFTPDGKSLFIGIKDTIFEIFPKK